MASRLGDQTARLQGRITLNPMYHVDPIGTLLFPALVIFGPFFGFNFFSGFLIGWAKPTPVITRNFKKIVRDDNLVTLAGPASNLILVLVALACLMVDVGGDAERQSDCQDFICRRIRSGRCRHGTTGGARCARWPS